MNSMQVSSPIPRLQMPMTASDSGPTAVPKLNLSGSRSLSPSREAESQPVQQGRRTSRFFEEHVAQNSARAAPSVPKLTLGGLRKESHSLSLSMSPGLGNSPNQRPSVPKLAMASLQRTVQASQTSLPDVALAVPAADAAPISPTSAEPVPDAWSGHAATSARGPSRPVSLPTVPALLTADLAYSSAGKSPGLLHYHSTQSILRLGAKSSSAQHCLYFCCMIILLTSSEFLSLQRRAGTVDHFCSTSGIQ